MTNNPGKVKKTTSLNGREWLRVEDLAPGKTVQVDGGFDCLREGSLHQLKQDANGEFYINCAEGKHYIFSETNHIIGIWPASSGAFRSPQPLILNPLFLPFILGIAWRFAIVLIPLLLIIQLFS